MIGLKWNWRKTAQKKGQREKEGKRAQRDICFRPPKT